MIPGDSEVDVKNKTADKQRCSVNLAVPFISNRLAVIAKNSIDADEVPNPELISRIIRVDGDQLKPSYRFKKLYKDLITTIMVFISFPNSTTSEEEALLKKYDKLDKKRKSLEKAAKPEPEVVATTNNRPIEAKDAKKVIEKLKKIGQLPLITNTGQKREFKRKIPQNAAASVSKQNKIADESREVVSYDDDLFS